MRAADPMTKVRRVDYKAKDMAGRVDAIDWARASKDLDAQGSALIEHLLSPAECDALAALYASAGLFRSRVVMERHGFGRGEYQYFSYPLPDLLGELRTAVYSHLVPVANHWNEAMGIDLRYPEKHADFVEREGLSALLTGSQTHAT